MDARSRKVTRMGKIPKLHLERAQFGEVVLVWNSVA